MVMSDVQNEFEFEVNQTPNSICSDFIEANAKSDYITWFGDPGESAIVGGKNASLSSLYKMCTVRTDTSLRVPNGFCLNTRAYKHFIGRESVQNAIHAALDGCDITNVPSLIEASEKCRSIVYEATGPHLPGNRVIWEDVVQAYNVLSTEYGLNTGLSVAVRSSATAEDLPMPRLRVSTIHS